ncbi:kynurenine/alpha-aminoadipate aminotransferase, mitochondrial-like isoform X2 [Copidosoma floridanum]|uniref:kynurenine/alpha-aminoadipate aminotransferase, mitochondrial-like isoform X2 n=1 Tax=Copidosoma floridanum TaxID=29053 RepID=UPI000C6F4996|nr:kynurenine/alpha-aminoadipate aminotransferase, mitochondrial-like isoform X2 [Copidosoma floridanum]
MNYSKFVSKIGKRRKPNLIRSLSGMPNASMFPIEEISVTYSDGTRKQLTGSELSPALQYGASKGYPPLLQKWREFQTKWHSPRYDDWDVQVTTGSMEGCSKIFELILNEGDPVMAQSPTYGGILTAVMPLNPDFIEIGVDDDGAVPSDIANACEERLRSGKPLPKLLYVNPTGANPVGTVYTTERKREIYELARKYDFLIMEDDAYYFLHFLDETPVSFFSLDVDGRVLRLDSCSKILSAGLRIGFITGPKPLLAHVVRHVEATTLHTSSLSQVVVYQLLNSWSDDQMKKHFSQIQEFYRERRDIMLNAIEKYFTGIAEWSVPKGGMFFWMKVNDLDDVYDLVMKTCVPQGVFVMPGHAFYPSDTSRPCRYLRICYSMASPEDIDEGLSKVASLIRQSVADKKRKLNGLTAKCV